MAEIKFSAVTWGSADAAPAHRETAKKELINRIVRIHVSTLPEASLSQEACQHGADRVELARMTSFSYTELQRTRRY
jgi:hypothetical protein